jgi:2-iminobutanoate/2-iminopropanoate deaminase
VTLNKKNGDATTMTRQIIATDKAPKAIGPYSQAVAANGFLFTSGQLPIDPATGQLVAGTIEEQAHQVFKNLSAIAQEAGAGLADAVKTTVFLSDINHFKAVNAVYDQYFTEPFPARSAFQVGALPLNAGIEVEAVFQLQ